MTGKQHAGEKKTSVKSTPRGLGYRICGSVGETDERLIPRSRLISCGDGS